MYFSCKITNSVLSYLETQKVDLAAYFSETDVPWDFLKDPSNWMHAPDMEAFLERIIKNRNDLSEAGRKTPKLRSWGVLDSVLRMMPRPQEIFNQPEKFLSYFISPQPPLENLVRSDVGISFDIPLPAEQYPLVTSYLIAAFETLPVFVGQTPGLCKWTHIRFEFYWQTEQATIFSETDHQISPQLMQEVIEQLQSSSKELEEKNRELQRRNEELQRLTENHANKSSAGSNSMKLQLSDSDFAQFEFIKKPTHQVAQNLARLHDYMVRAHQLVTLLTAGQKQTAGMKAAFHKVDWDLVKNHYPQIIFESLEILKQMNQPEIEHQKNQLSLQEEFPT